MIRHLSLFSMVLVSSNCFASKSNEIFNSETFCENAQCASERIQQTDREECPCKTNCFQGLSFDFGGQYTWMHFTSSPNPTFTGSTGGFYGSLVYQKSDAFFGQIKSVYNFNPLSSSLRSSSGHEWYTECLAGYSLANYRCEKTGLWGTTLYLGLGLDYLTDIQATASTLSKIRLNYQTYYVLAGAECNYTMADWRFALQAEILPEFQQLLSIGGLTGAAWKSERRIGFAARLPIAYKLTESLWLETTPYYRFLPIGKIDVLSMPSRNLQQVGVFATIRLFF